MTQHALKPTNGNLALGLLNLLPLVEASFNASSLIYYNQTVSHSIQLEDLARRKNIHA